MRLPTPLPPGVVAEEFTYANGETATTYRAPFQVEGPVRFTDRSGIVVLTFMYAHFVFVWRAARHTVDVSHGQIGGTNLVLYRGVPITGPWGEDTLAAFGTAWASRHMARFRGHV
jgi:hypothetical protein